MSLLDYCETDAQREKARLYEELGSCERVAERLGLDRRTVEKVIKKVKERASVKGYSPEHGMVHTVPDPFIVKGISTLHKTETGLQWVKSTLKEEHYLQSVIDAVNSACEDATPFIPRTKPIDCDFDIVPWLNIGDGHFNMIAHESETGQRFDVEIAEREMKEAICLMIDAISPCQKMVLQDVADFTHFENFAKVTAGHGHALDGDKPFADMIALYTRLMRFIVEKCLEKAVHLDVIVSQGNHSRTNDIWIAHYLRAVFEPCGRVTVLDNSSVLIPYRMGKTFVLCHHGDKIKPAQLVKVMATDFPEDWGASEFRYVDMGHIHHQMQSKEHEGARVESFNTLAAKDKYAHDGGWRSKQAMTLVFRSRTYGEIGRKTLPIQQVWDSLIAKHGEANVYVPQPRRAYVG